MLVPPQWSECECLPVPPLWHTMDPWDVHAPLAGGCSRCSGLYGSVLSVACVSMYAYALRMVVQSVLLFEAERVKVAVL